MYGGMLTITNKDQHIFKKKKKGQALLVREMFIASHNKSMPRNNY